MKTLILAFVTLSVVLSICHNSCDTCNGNICLTCVIPNSEVDPHQRACICKAGFYVSSVNPLVCDALVVGSQQDQCEIEIALNIGDFIVSSNCYYSTENVGGVEKNYVISDITIDTDHSQLNSVNCRASIVSKVQYRPLGNNAPLEDDQYVDLPNPSEVTDLPGGKTGDKRIKIPLIEIYSLSYYQSISGDGSQIIQEFHFRILIGFTRKFLRSHRCIMTVYTNRSQIQAFTIDVDIQSSETCQNPSDCVIIADLDVTGDQYLQNWITVRTLHNYVVGDWMYMRIWFKDSTYTKQLSFQKLYFKNDLSQVFDFTSQTDPLETKWSSVDKSLHVKLLLTEPSTGAIVQVNMLIETADARLRTLQNESQSVKKQFTAEILSPLPSKSANAQSSNSANSIIILFGLLNLLGLILFY